MVETETPRVWVGCLAAYNGGRLHGEWLDATDADELREGVQRVLASSPVPLAEEWFVADYDGFGEAATRLGEYPNLEQVAEIGAAIEEYGGAVAAWIANGDEWDVERFAESYCGQWDSLKDYAYQLADDIALFDGLPEDHAAVTYFDWDYWTRDLELGGDYWTADAGLGEGVYVFRSY